MKRKLQGTDLEFCVAERLMGSKDCGTTCECGHHCKCCLGCCCPSYKLEVSQNVQKASKNEEEANEQ